MQQNEKRTKIILWAVVAAAVIGCALWLLLPHGGTTDCTAEIWIDGQMVRGIYLPQVMPYFRTAVSLGLGLCWKAGAAAEIIGLPAGSMGERLYTAKVYFQTADLFAWTVTIVAVSVVFERLFLALVDRLMGKAGL